MPETTVVRRQLGRRLKALREAADKKPADVEAAHLGSKEKVWRVETGKVAVNVPTVRSWCAFYGAAADETEALAAMALGTSQRGWWEEFGAGAVPEWFKLYVGLEQSATAIWSWDDTLIPGPLQTADYARAVFRAWRPASESDVERQVGVRLKRQERLLGRQSPPRLFFVLGEGALAWQVGGPEVMAGQVEHLRDLAKREDFEILVLPFGVGAHPAMAGSFVILDFDDDPSVVYLEARVGARYLEKSSELNEYRSAFEAIRQLSRPIGE